MQQQTGGDYDRKRDVKDILERTDSLEELEEVSMEDASDEAATRLSDDDVFNVLYNSVRRDIITYLREQDGSSTVSDIAEHIAARENDTTVQLLSSYERKRVYIGLYQNHLPMMDNVGVIDYDKNRGTVRLRKCASQLEPYLEGDDTSNGSRLKIGGSVGLAGVILLGLLDVGAFDAVPDPFWVALGAVGLVGLSAIDSYADFYPDRLSSFLEGSTERTPNE